METFMVGYDLSAPGKNYDDLLEAIKAYGTGWHHLDSTWLIRSTDEATTIRDHLGMHIGSGDELLVIKVTGATAAWKGSNAKASDWIMKDL